MGEGWDMIPADAFVVILLRLPPSSRRRLRLVCRHWRDVVDERTPERQARAKILAFVAEHGRSHAYVSDDCRSGKAPEPGGRSREVWSSGGADGMSMVGTCNGLLCLHRKNDGGVVLVNPVTGAMLAVPPPPPPATTSDRRCLETADTYSFAYLPATGQHKIVHLPCRRGGAFDAVHVFTLGVDTSWREVPAPPGSSCCLSFGLAGVGGATYWVTKDAERLVSFDLKDERVAFAKPLLVPVPSPAWALLGYSCRLADVGGRLGIAICCINEPETSKTEVWVLEDDQAWARRCTVVVRGQKPNYEVASPHFAHGEYVLTSCPRWQSDGTGVMTMCAHLPREDEDGMLQGGVVRIDNPEQGPAVREDVGYSFRTFVYVETTEPLCF
ncbi:hypothetical protein ACP70R_016221 [Stipagrostis hirtigluma subsp. patula]